MRAIGEVLGEGVLLSGGGQSGRPKLSQKYILNVLGGDKGRGGINDIRKEPAIKDGGLFVC